MEISLERGLECAVSLIAILVVYVLIFLAVHPWVVGLLYLINGARFVAENYSAVMLFSGALALLFLLALLSDSKEGEKDAQQD